MTCQLGAGPIIVPQWALSAVGGWTGHPGAGLLVGEGRARAWLAALWALARHSTVSSRDGWFQAPAICRLEVSFQTQERKWRLGQAQGRIRAGGPWEGASRKPWGGPASGAGLPRQVCVCAHVCTCTPACQGSGPWRGSAGRVSHQECSGVRGSMRQCERPAHLRTEGPDKNDFYYKAPALSN